MAGKLTEPSRKDERAMQEVRTASKSTIRWGRINFKIGWMRPYTLEKITDVDMILTGRNPENITILDEKFDEIYLNKVHELSLSPESVKKHRDMKIVYSPMHGAGVRLVPASLRKFGFTNIIMVKEQAVIDGNFPTVESPNLVER